MTSSKAFTPEIINHLSWQLLRVTENAAIAAAWAAGQGDKELADQAAVDAMRRALTDMDGFTTNIKIGEGERDDAPMLFIGEQLGSGEIPIDIAVDPLENTNATANLNSGAVCVLAASSQGGLVQASVDPADRSATSPDGPFASDAETVTRPVRLVELPVGATEDRVLGSLHLEKAPPKSIRMQDVSLVGRAAKGQAIKGIKSGLPVTAITAPQVRISPNGGGEEVPDGGGAPPGGGAKGKTKRSQGKPSGPEANGKVGSRGAGPAPKTKTTAKSKASGAVRNPPSPS
mgnify:CR=1 FL=1